MALLPIVLICTLAVWSYLWFIERSSPQRESYSFIEDNLYVGPCVGEPPPGTKAVVNLIESQDAYDAEETLWEPIKDAAPAPSLDWLKQVVEFVDAQRRKGSTVYVHCANGVSRSGMVCAAYLMYERKWDRDTALEFLRAKRPQINPHPAFMRLLSEWENSLAIIKQ
jgi:hypothetical protein